VGLAPQWYLLAYSLLFEVVAPAIHEHYEEKQSTARDAVVALEKAFMLDASLALDTYIASDRYRRLQQLESIVNDSGEVIFSLDAENRFRTWNRAAERLFGWKAEELLGKHFRMLVPPELLKEGELARIDAAIHERGHYHFQTQRLTKDGRRVPVEVMVSLLRDPQGNPLGRSAILRDITHRKRLEEEKLRAERLAVIGSMSARLAHEIRNPLSSITLNIELVRDEIEELTKDKPETATESRALLQSLDSEVRRIQHVTEDYLKFARMPKPHPETVELNEVLVQGLSFMQSLFDATKVRVQTQLDETLPPLYADEHQLWQAVLNLIRNAIEAMPGGGTITIRTVRAADAVVLTIADTGKGMSAEEHAQIFKPFFSTKTGGTGLGLPLTQQIIAEHGGQIRCETSPDRGTTFVIELPQKEGKRHAQET
jgi:PAS domain S-box-containing protein